MSDEKILIIDDEKPINKLVASYVTNEHYRAYSAYTGAEALNLVRREDPDLIILDIMLPDVEGTALCLDIRVLDKDGQEIDLHADDDDVEEGGLESEYVNSDSDFANNGYGFEDEEGNQVSGDDLFEESDEPDDYGDGDEDL